MNPTKRKALVAKGYKIGNVDEFLGLSKEEMDFIDLKIALAKGVTETRRRKKLTQAQLAKTLGSGQSRIAKLEKGDPSVSFDLIIKALLALGAKKSTFARLLAA